MPPAPRTRFAYCDKPLPHPAGESPFHIKGEFYRLMAGTVEHYEKKTSADGARPSGLRGFITQPFLASAFYDVLPMPFIAMAIAERLGRDVHELTSRLGTAAVEWQMKGVYARLLAAVTPQNFCDRFDQLIQHFYDFGPVSVTPAEGGARLVRRGVPLCIGEWWSLVTVPFAAAPLSASGARDVDVKWRVQPTGVDRGVDVGDVHWDVRWTVGQAPR